MKRKAASFYAGLSAVCLCVMLSVFLLCGCEDSDGTSGLTVSPSAVTLSGSSNTVTFTVSSNSLRELSYPLEWSVQNASLGRILASAGNSAVYYSSGAGGVNIVMVQDQYEAEGLATVTQE